LSSFLRYFKRELLPLGAIEETHMPQYLSSWTDKNSPQCMYTVYLVRLWSIAHLRACCWYIDCGKAFCPVEEEDAKKACDEADSQGAALGANQGEVQEEEVEVDIDKLPEKEKIKVLNQRKRDADRAKAKTDREALRAKEKAERDAKKGGRSGKSKAVVASTPSPVLPQVSTASQSQNPRKRDSSCAQLSLSRLQQITSPALMDSAGGGLHVQEFFFSGSLLSTDAYYVQHQAFPKEWVDMKAFLELVCNLFL
jgi:hypothetical protein